MKALPTKAWPNKAWTAWTAAPALLFMAAALMVAPADGQTARAKSKKGATPPPVAAPAAPVAEPAPPQEPLAAAVQSYAAYQGEITALQNATGLSSADELERALDRAAGVNRDALTRGFIAYGALTAAQSPEFVRGVRDVASHYGRDVMIRGLTLDPGYAQTLKGGEEAARLALVAARADGRRVFATGERYKEFAYSLQNQRWANQVAPGQPARVNRMRTLASGAATRNIGPELTPRLTAAPGTLTPWTDPTQLGGVSFWDSLRVSPAPGVAAPLPAPVIAPAAVRPHHDRVGTVNRMTTLAALYVLDATKEPAAQADRLLAEGSTQRCLELAQVQFYQCMSAARFRYENAFCLGEHALKDMGACISGATEEVPSASPVAVLPQAPEVAAPVVPPANTRKKR